MELSHDRISPGVGGGLVSQKLEEVVQAGQAAVDGRGDKALLQLILDECGDVSPPYLSGRLVEKTLKGARITDIVLRGTAVRIPAIQIALEFPDTLFRWLPPGFLLYIRSAELRVRDGDCERAW